MNYDGQEGGIKYLEFYDIFTCERNYKKGSYPVFQGGLQGIIDTLIPYRSYTAKDWDEKEKVTATIFSPLLVAGSFFIYIGIELP
ncbi:MAG: hypothetical protein KDK36_21125, partial [Leptospiraceae bacterium]|nr:hypothetical protein [Leptospiraceae bacterium]